MCSFWSVLIALMSMSARCSGESLASIHGHAAWAEPAPTARMATARIAARTFIELPLPLSCAVGKQATAWALGSRRFDERRLEAEVGDSGLAELELLDLAGDGHRELVDGDHVARHLVVSDPALTERAYGLGVDRAAFAGDHERGELLA